MYETLADIPNHATDDNEERAFVGGAMNEMAYVFQAWLPLLIWQQVDAPQYKKGFISMICISVTLMATAMTTRYLHNREIKQYVAYESYDDVTIEFTDADQEARPG